VGSPPCAGETAVPTQLTDAAARGALSNSAFGSRSADGSSSTITSPANDIS